MAIIEPLHATEFDGSCRVDSARDLIDTPLRCNKGAKGACIGCDLWGRCGGKTSHRPAYIPAVIMVNGIAGAKIVLKSYGG